LYHWPGGECRRGVSPRLEKLIHAAGRRVYTQKIAFFWVKPYVLTVHKKMRRVVLVHRKSPLMGIGIAVLAVVLVLALRILGMPVLGDESPFLLFFSALALASWYGGFVPGIIATLLGSISVAFLFLPPVRGKIEYAHLLHHFVFISTGILISWLMKRLHSALERSNQAEAALEDRVQERTIALAAANRELQSEKDKLMGILDSMPESVYIVNPQFEVEYTNPAMEREFGKPEGRKCYQYLCGWDADICSWCRNSEIFTGKTFSNEYISPKNNMAYDCFEAPITNQSGILCKLKIMHNITSSKQTEAELSRKNRQLEEASVELQRLSSEILTAQENERIRIARELHDDLGQALTLIKLKIGLIDMKLAETLQPLRSFCEDASSHVDQAIENMRRLSHDLCPATIEALGITIALQRLAEDFDNAGGIRIHADIDSIDALPLQSSILLYRVFQEGLNNIVKHSGAKSAGISLKKNNGSLTVEIKDDGKGLELKGQESTKPAFSKGFGLTIMRERVRTLGGSLEIQGREKEGTKLFFTIPA
jgi:signal transduction histidine kinase